MTLLTPRKLPAGFGVGVPWEAPDHVQRAALDLLDPPVWYNWRTHPMFDHPANDRFMPMLWSIRTQSDEILPSGAGFYEGTSLAPSFENEPDGWMDPDHPQSRTDPETAAEFMRRIRRPWSGFNLLRGANSRWAHYYRNADGPIPDAHAYHMYRYTIGQWAEAFNQLRNHPDVANRPLLITETALWPSDYLGHDEYVVQSKELISHLGRLVRSGRVQAAFWFSAYRPLYDFWQPTSLLELEDGEARLTELGQHYVDARHDYLTYLPSVGRS